MKYYLFLSTAIASVLGNIATAGTMGSAVPSQNSVWVASITAGPIWARGGETQSFYLAPEIEKTYAAKKFTHAAPSGELFLGIQKTLSSLWQGQFGLAAATTGNAKLKGMIWDDADPQFDNYSYLYKVKNTRLAVKGKLLRVTDYWLKPWVSASLGVGFNDAHAFTNTPLIFEALPNANFNNHTKTAFTYTLGAGVQKHLNAYWQLGLGYEFADWGKSALDRAADQALNTGLNLSHLYTNGILFNLTYIA